MQQIRSLNSRGADITLNTIIHGIQNKLTGQYKVEGESQFGFRFDGGLHGGGTGQPRATD